MEALQICDDSVWGYVQKSVLLATGKELIPIFTPQVFMKVCFGCDTKLLWLLEADFPPLELLPWQNFLLLSLEVSPCPLPPPGSLKGLQEASHGALQSREGRQGPH